MRAGWLRHRLTIQQDTPSRGDWGEEIASWSTFATVWGSVEPARGGERAYAGEGQVESHLQVRIRIRYRTGLSTEMRVYWAERTRTFRILSIVEPAGRQRELILLCEEVQG